MRTGLIGVLGACCLAAAGARAAPAALPSPATPVAMPAAETSPAMPDRDPSADYAPVVAGLGAIAGVVTFNLVGLGVAALPAAGAYAAGATVPAEMSVAMSRVYATSSAVLGAVLADYLYSR